jgi:aminoglycoside 3-N-acetyltransferase
MPAFTYCFESSTGNHEIFDREKSPSKVGAVSETFRMMPDVVRTASPTHSFSLWGKITKNIDPNTSPDSPFGKGSILDWLANHPETFILLLGVDFTAMSFCHYLEAKAPVPWADYSPWGYLNVRKVGVSTNGKQVLKEIPGCSKSFINFENYLLQQKVIASVREHNLNSYFLRVGCLYQEGIKYIRRDPEKFLCPKTSCRTCDSRHEFYENLLTNRHSN